MKSHPGWRVLTCVVSPLAALFVLIGCDAPCTNEPISSASSPSGSLKAVVFQRACGATVGENTQVSVLAGASALPEGAGNALIVKGRPTLRVSWASETQLVIAGARASETFKREVNVGAVTVAYE